MTTTSSPSKPPEAGLWKRRTARWSRWLHTYLSMVSFTILLFFAITGLTLNHQSAWTGLVSPKRFTGTLDVSWLKTPADHKAEIVRALRSRHGIKANLSDFRTDDDQVQVSFKGPGYSADGFADRRTGKYEVNENRMGLVAIVNDLHKGRDTGRAWAGVIDISAILMVLVSLSGLVLIFFLHKRLRAGLAALAIGTVLCYAVYQVWVP